MDSRVSETSLREEAFDILPTAALVVDRSGVILQANRKMSRTLLDFTGNPCCLGKRLDDMFARDAEFLMTDLRTAASGGRLIIWLRDVADNLSGRMCFQVVAMVGHRRRPEHFLLLEDRAKPITREFSELSSKLRQANETAAETHLKNRQLIENYELLEQFSLVAAHDLKAPLLNISLLLEFLQDEYGAILDGPAQDLVVAAKKSATRLQNLISALLNHARSGTAQLNVRTIDIASSVEAVRQSLAVELRETDAEIRIAGELGTVQADPVLFDQLLHNIIGNSLKYRAQERSPIIRIERLPDDKCLGKLVISDNGSGFDPAEKDRLFEPFKRLFFFFFFFCSGVGLSICKTVCNRHGWSIDAKGIPGVGAAFEIGGIDAPFDRLRSAG